MVELKGIKVHVEGESGHHYPEWKPGCAGPRSSNSTGCWKEALVESVAGGRYSIMIKILPGKFDFNGSRDVQIKISVDGDHISTRYLSKAEIDSVNQVIVRQSRRMVDGQSTNCDLVFAASRIEENAAANNEKRGKHGEIRVVVARGLATEQPIESPLISNKPLTGLVALPKNVVLKHNSHSTTHIPSDKRKPSTKTTKTKFTRASSADGGPIEFILHYRSEGDLEALKAIPLPTAIKHNASSGMKRSRYDLEASDDDDEEMIPPPKIKREHVGHDDLFKDSHSTKSASQSNIDSNRVNDTSTSTPLHQNQSQADTLSVTDSTQSASQSNNDSNGMHDTNINTLPNQTQFQDDTLSVTESTQSASRSNNDSNGMRNKSASTLPHQTQSQSQDNTLSVTDSTMSASQPNSDSNGVHDTSTSKPPHRTQSQDDNLSVTDTTDPSQIPNVRSTPNTCVSEETASPIAQPGALASPERKVDRKLLRLNEMRAERKVIRIERELLEMGIPASLELRKKAKLLRSDEIALEKDEIKTECELLELQARAGPDREKDLKLLELKDSRLEREQARIVRELFEMEE